MYKDLVKLIEEQLAEQEVVVIAISGHGGSGKSTLAEKLAQQFNIAKNQIIQSDALHAKDYMQTRDLFGMHDWDSIFELLANIRNDDRLNYTKRDDKEIESVVDIPRPRLVIIEGIRLIRPEILPFVDESIWVDCPLEIATMRAKERNRQQGDSEAEIALWDSKWAPEAKLYFEQVKPDKISSFIYRDQGLTLT
ncbi:MAG: AAA family ATPase [Acidimicrobiia bacterium]|nr:AAA family ATPase [Acidimicrobiia bacterium]